VLIFTKPARPGLVKTRLIGDLNADQAAQLHAAFLADLLDRLSAGTFSVRVLWALSPDEPLPESDFPAHRQTGDDLGERLFRGLEAALNDSELAAAIGSDHPDLSVSRVEEAFDKLLRGAEIVLGPAADGGYYLIAVRKHSLDEELFRAIPWSTAEVFETTLRRCQKLGLRVETLAQAADVDTPEDLRSLAIRLSRSNDSSCPRTRELLRDWKLLPSMSQRRSRP
jgi:rSAM/selenodomain-associated transferase 1